MTHRRRAVPSLQCTVKCLVAGPHPLVLGRSPCVLPYPQLLVPGLGQLPYRLARLITGESAQIAARYLELPVQYLR